MSQTERVVITHTELLEEHQRHYDNLTSPPNASGHYIELPSTKSPQPMPAVGQPPRSSADSEVAIAKRLALFGHVVVPVTTERAMGSVYAILAKCADTLRAAVKGVPYDGGRFIHALDLLLDVQHTVTKALEMPHSIPTDSK